MSLGELFAGEKPYEIAGFKRDYSWGVNEWQSLWLDLKLARENGRNYYMGDVIVMEKSSNYQIIDGQQRLVTLSLLILAGARCLANQELRQQIMSDFLYAADAVPARHQSPLSRLNLNRINDDCYQRLLRGDGGGGVREHHQSNAKIQEALAFFKEQISEEFGKNADDSDIIEVIKGRAGNAASFTVLSVDNAAAAIEAYETLNTRGMPLSNHDLLKSFVYTSKPWETVSPTDLNILDGLWDTISVRLKDENPDHFVRSFHISRTGENIPHSGVYHETTKELAHAGKLPILFFEDMAVASAVYADMRFPKAASWANPHPGKDLENLVLYGSNRHFALLLAAHKKWGASIEFAKLAEYCATIVFRHSIICEFNPDKLDAAFGKATAALLNGAEKASTLLPCLADVYPSDNKFRASFAEKAFSADSKRLAKSVMFALEHKMSGTDYNPNNKKYTIEHILPQNPGGNFPAFNKQQHERCLWRIGNLALMEAKANKGVANAPMSKKRAAYQESDFMITRKGTDGDKWEKSHIDARQRELAKIARTVWKIQFPR